MFTKYAVLSILIFCFLSNLKAKVKPLDYKKYSHFILKDDFTEFLENSTPSNLNPDDDFKKVGIKLILHNLKNLHNFHSSVPRVKKNQASKKINGSTNYYREIITPSFRLKFEKDVDAEINLKADLPKQHITFKLVTDLAEGQMLYHFINNTFMVSVSKMISKKYSLSITDTRQLENSNSSLMLSFNYYF